MFTVSGFRASGSVKRFGFRMSGGGLGYPRVWDGLGLRDSSDLCC